MLGVRGRPAYVEGSTEVAAGSSIVLYTDGLVERRGELLDTGLDRLATAAAHLAELGPAELVAALADATLGATGPADDVALLVVRAVPRRSRPVARPWREHAGAAPALGRLGGGRRTAR